MNIPESMYNNFFLKSKEDAENLYNDILVIVGKYGRMTIYDYYELASNHCALFGSNTIKYAGFLKGYGWGDEVRFDVNWIMCEDGRWKMVMPEPTNIFKRMDEEEPEMGNDISNPDYYKSEGIEVIDVIRAFTEDLTGVEAFATGNIIKYACRWKKKNGIADLKKILWYTQYLIDSISCGDDDSIEEEFVVNEALQASFAIHGLIFENEEIAKKVLHLAKAHIHTFGFITLRDFVTTIVLGRTKEKVFVELRPDIDPDRYGWTYNALSHARIMKSVVLDCFVLELPELEEDD